MLTPGDRLRDYEVIAPLPSGGMAKLYLARRRGVGGFSQQVALKLVHPGLVSDQSMLELFLDEARLAAHVVHPNVVRVHEVGFERGNYFIAMEYVDGASLSELLEGLRVKRLRLRRKLCVWLACQIAEALHATHEAKGENGAPLDIVHCDVSPQNVLIGNSGHVKLIDFGVASSRASVSPLETGPFVLGKLRYASPERLKLEPTDRRADVYALGVMLWEMLTARSFLRCRNVEDPYDWAIRENPPPPRKYAPHVPSMLDAVVLKAIHPDPQLRYPDALRFRRALLRADPSAARVDAARIAALMELALGDQPDRRQTAALLQQSSFVEELVSAPGELKSVPSLEPAGSLSSQPPPRYSAMLPPPPALPAGLVAASDAPAPVARTTLGTVRSLHTALICALLGILIGISVLNRQAAPAGRTAPNSVAGAPSVQRARPELRRGGEPREAARRPGSARRRLALAIAERGESASAVASKPAARVRPVSGAAKRAVGVRAGERGAQPARRRQSKPRRAERTGTVR